MQYIENTIECRLYMEYYVNLLNFVFKLFLKYFKIDQRFNEEEINERV